MATQPSPEAFGPVRAVALRQYGFAGLARAMRAVSAADPKNATLAAFAVEAQKHADEADRLTRGAPPSPFPPALPYVEDASRGSVEAARLLVIHSPDFQRGAWAHWLVTQDAPPEAVRAALEIALCQDNFFRQIPELWRCLRHADFTPPAGLPEVFAIYRGEGDDGLSWTLSPEVAERFAGLFKTHVIGARARRSDVAFYSDIRGEREVILWPEATPELVQPIG